MEQKGNTAEARCPYGPPQEGMVENFGQALTEAGKHIRSVLEKEEALETIGAKGVAVLLEALAFSEFALGPEHPPYDIGGVMVMLETGRCLENTISIFSASIQETVKEVVGQWKQAIINFPMPRRFAPAVEWAITGVSPVQPIIMRVQLSVQ